MFVKLQTTGKKVEAFSSPLWGVLLHYKWCWSYWLQQKLGGRQCVTHYWCVNIIKVIMHNCQIKHFRLQQNISIVCFPHCLFLKGKITIKKKSAFLTDFEQQLQRPLWSHCKGFQGTNSIFPWYPPSVQCGHYKCALLTRLKILHNWI